MNRELDFASHDQYPGGYYAIMPHENNYDMVNNENVLFNNIDVSLVENTKVEENAVFDDMI